MTYVVSDLHGCVERFRAMLALINFCSEDTLYIVGDVIDRYPGGIDLIEYIMANSNIHLIRGNHEQLLLDYLGHGSNPRTGSKALWFINGGEITYNEFMALSEGQKSVIIDFLNKTPIWQKLQIEDRKFYLVHAGPDEVNTENALCARMFPDTVAFFEDDIVTIVGHTPTPHMYGSLSECRIWHSNDGKIIDLDCGCGTHFPQRKLGCLRLEDMKEFYL